jgi:hypothetical protein
VRGRGLRDRGVAQRLDIGKPRRRRGQLGRMTPLRVPLGGIRVRQLLLERDACRSFPRKPLFEFRLALGGVGEVCRGALLGVLVCRLRLGERELERAPGPSGFRQSRGELGFALVQVLDGRSSFRGSFLHGIVERGLRLCQAPLDGDPRVDFPGEPLLELRLAPGRRPFRSRAFHCRALFGLLQCTGRVREPLFRLSARSNGFRQHGAELRFTPREVLGRGGCICRSSLPGLVERSRCGAQLLRKGITRPRRLRQAGCEFRVPLREMVD